ncbi:chorismate mutase [Pantoea sp. Acro-805]|uniref:chorismate mutase n=1 Tax=Candidatus Pantoea formicae TaxID=2608355 RepID=A0ABX0R4P8_9GAMM|nr:chorismate mutase [Pantoea formicae]MDF7650003.1 chorismate mutase [Erwiniaceae bacterium L1_54_3]NIF02511.1 chorismate mutase [Pantoea formicae]
MHFSSIEDVRSRIDQIDSELVKIIAQRAECVKAAAAFKTSHAAVRAPDRVQQVVNKARARAADLGLPEEVIETVYRAMIDAFIDYELKQHDQLRQGKTD